MSEWWKQSADPAPAGATGQSKQESDLPIARETAPEPDIDGESLGEQVDRAIGEFDSKLARLNEELEDKKAEIRELESAIADAEKEQAKAFKKLMSNNSRIKEMLGGGPTKKKQRSRKRKTARKPKPEPAPDDLDNDPLL